MPGTAFHPIHFCPFKNLPRGLLFFDLTLGKMLHIVSQQLKIPFVPFAYYQRIT